MDRTPHFVKYDDMHQFAASPLPVPLIFYGADADRTVAALQQTFGDKVISMTAKSVRDLIEGTRNNADPEPDPRTSKNSIVVVRDLADLSDERERDAVLLRFIGGWTKFRAVYVPVPSEMDLKYHSAVHLTIDPAEAT